MDDGKMIKPQALNIGDTIAFCAPAAPLDTTRIILAKKRLTEMGFYVLQPVSLSRRWGYLAGSDVQRAEELMAFALEFSPAAALHPLPRALGPGLLSGSYGPQGRRYGPQAR